MAGHLQIHPYFKSWDEINRSRKRLDVYLEMHVKDDIERQKLQKMIRLLDEAMTYIPKQYQLTKHELKKLKEGK